MKQVPKSLFTISLFLFSLVLSAQEEKSTDSIPKTEPYGLRFGVDLAQPINMLIDDDFQGFEIVTDYRFSKKFYAALEMGITKNSTQEDYMEFTTDGSYFKLGVNYNAYDNWVGMSNEIFVGARYAVSFLDQTLNSFTPNVDGTYFIPDTIEPNTTFSNLNAQWLEFVLGLKAETFKNLYLGFSLQFKIITTTKEPENFKNLFIPGFNQVSLNNMGFGFNYHISYLIPFTKKAK